LVLIVNEAPEDVFPAVGADQVFPVHVGDDPLLTCVKLLTSYPELA